MMKVKIIPKKLPQNGLLQIGEASDYEEEDKVNNPLQAITPSKSNSFKF